MLPSHVATRGIDLSIAGDTLVDRDLFVRKLGVPSWEVLQALWCMRNAKGRSHATRAAITKAYGFEAKTPRQVQRCFERLTQAYLLKLINRRRIEAEVPTAPARWDSWHLVRGAINVKDDSQIVIPNETAEWLTTAGRGGDRPGGGRPPKVGQNNQRGVGYDMSDSPSEAKSPGSSAVRIPCPIAGPELGQGGVFSLEVGSEAFPKPGPVNGRLGTLACEITIGGSHRR